jgi:hypothetical protein
VPTSPPPLHLVDWATTDEHATADASRVVTAVRARQLAPRARPHRPLSARGQGAAHGPTRPCGLPRASKDNPAKALFWTSSYWVLGNDESILFRLDQWLLGRSILDIAADLAAAVPSRRKNKLTVAAALQNDVWHRDITGALSIPILIQFLQVKQELLGIALDPLTQDRLVWRWNPSATYLSKSAYDAMFIGQSATLGAKELCSTRAPNKCRFYVWTVLHHQVWTSARLHRHGLSNNGPCAFRVQMDGTLDHLLAGCVFSRETRFKLLRRCGWSQVSPAPNDGFVDWWLRSRKRIPKLR